MSYVATILVVEDDPFAAELLEMRLAHLGCRVVAATDVKAGLALALSEQPAIAILDLCLGDDANAGLTLACLLRSDPRTRTLPLVLHSIFANRRGDHVAADGLMDEVLPKPFKLADLQGVLARLLPTTLPHSLDATVPGALPEHDQV